MTAKIEFHDMTKESSELKAMRLLGLVAASWMERGGWVVMFARTNFNCGIEEFAST